MRDDRHGTVTGYAYHRCRCTPCSLAFSEYRKAIKNTNRFMFTVEPLGEWTERALCKGRADWEIPARELQLPARTIGALTDAAKRKCHECPVFEDCYGWISRHHDDPCPCHVVAGMTPKERRAERRRIALRASSTHQSHTQTA